MEGGWNVDVFITPIVIILGKYALDKGVELGQEVGPKALETAKEMFQLVLERIGQKKPETAAEFPQAPDTYQKPLEKALAAEAAADPTLAAQLKALLERYEQAAQEHLAGSSASYRATLTGSGAIAQGPGAVAAGAGGVAIGGTVQGDVRLTGWPDHTQPDDEAAET
jgi:hypothetical protein